jgi:hypothetical protein
MSRLREICLTWTLRQCRHDYALGAPHHLGREMGKIQGGLTLLDVVWSASIGRLDCLGYYPFRQYSKTPEH